MILYHFTGIELLPTILREGLSKGDIPLTRTTTDNAVWFTTDPTPAGHGLSSGEAVSPEALTYLERTTGTKLPGGIRTLDKRRVRIEVVIPSRDPLLKPWLPFARKRLAKEWSDILTDAGGGKAKARTWYLYFGTIQPSHFKAVAVRNDDGRFEVASEVTLRGLAQGLDDLIPQPAA